MEQGDPRAVLDAAAAGRGESLAALSRLIGRNAAYLQQFVRRGTPKRLEERDRALLARYLGIAEAALGGPVAAISAPTVSVRLVDVAASAGPGRLIDDERVTASLPFDRAMLERMGIRSTRLAMLRADGDSMAPGIEHGDRIMIDESDSRVGAAPAIYVLRLDGMLIVKRLSRRGDRLTIASDNPDHPPLPDRDTSDVAVLGRVVWLSRPVR